MVIGSGRTWTPTLEPGLAASSDNFYSSLRFCKCREKVRLGGCEVLLELQDSHLAVGAFGGEE
jgi:hypothetical protein